MYLVLVTDVHVTIVDDLIGRLNTPTIIIIRIISHGDLVDIPYSGLFSYGGHFRIIISY